MYEKGRGTRTPTCQRTVFNFCNLQEWKAKLKEWESEPRERQLSLVHQYLNPYQFTYVTDPVNWQMLDYWESPEQFLKKFGDCEDYAIIKYLSLRELGWSADDMRIVLLKDLNLRVNHAVLLVQFEGRQIVLDNQVRFDVIDAERIAHYQPYYSFNEKSYWSQQRSR
ncbi:MAG: transglutaminase-like cysteine peptidase [Sphingomonadales bacterium]